MAEDGYGSHDLPTVFISQSGRRALPKKRTAALGVIVVAILAVVGAGLYWLHGPSHVVRPTNITEQRLLQANLSSALSTYNSQSTVTVTTELINGQKSGSFSIDNNTLATYYLDRGTAYINLRQYSLAIPDFQETARLDSGLRLAALQEELQADYLVGEREQLIPILQELEKLSATSNDPQDDGSPAQYQQDIQDIKSNQPIDF